MMNAQQLAAMADGIVATVKEYVGGIVSGIDRRFSEFEARINGIPAGPQGEKGAPGERGEPGHRGEKGDRGEPGERGEKGADADPALIEELVEKAVARVPVIKGDRGEKGDPGPAGKDAEPIHPDTIARMVLEATQKAVAELPKPRDGKDADPVLIEKLVKAEVSTAIAAMPAPKDGEQGPAGKDGRDGKDADLDQVRALVDESVSRVVAALPAPKDGRDGKDADPDVIAAMVSKAVDPITRDIDDLFDEVMRGLEDDRMAFEAAHPGVVVHTHFHGGAKKSAQGESEDESGSIARAIHAVGASIERKLSMPVVPVRDKKGKIVATRRVESLDDA